MPEEHTEAPVEPQVGSNPDAPQDEGQGDQQTFDRPYVEKLRSESAKHRTRAKEAEARAKELQTKLERAGLDDIGRLKAEKEELAAQLEAARNEATAASIRAQVAGVVTDPDYALWYIQQNEGLVNEDGKVDVDALLKAKPTLKAQPDPRPGPAPTTAGGSNRSAVDMNTLIRQKAGR